MEKTFDIIRTTRGNFLKLINDVSPERMNQVPDGFNNNIAWHLGHLLSSQQVLCYEFSDSSPVIGTSVINRFRTGTKPDGEVTHDEIEHFKQLLITTIDRLETDYASGMLENYKAYTTRYGVHITSIADVIPYVSVHEALHLGYAMALKRVVI